MIEMESTSVGAFVFAVRGSSGGSPQRTPSLRATPVHLAWGGALPPRTPMLPGCTSLSCSELLTLRPSLSPPSSLSGLTHLSVALKILIEHRQLSWPECMQEELTSTLKAPPRGGQQRGQGRGSGTNHIFPEVGSSAAVPNAQKKLGLEPTKRTLPLSLQLPSLTTTPAPYFPRRPLRFKPLLQPQSGPNGHPFLTS